MKSNRQYFNKKLLHSDSVVYNQIYIKHQKIKSNEHLRYLAILYSDRLYAGTKSIDDYKDYTFKDIARELKLRAIMKKIENDRIIKKKKDEEESKQKRLMETLKKHTNR